MSFKNDVRKQPKSQRKEGKKEKKIEKRKENSEVERQFGKAQRLLWSDRPPKFPLDMK